MNASNSDTDGAAANVETQADSVSTEPQTEPSALEALAAERDQLVAERNDLKDLLQPSRAEFDNFRRRVEREKMEVAEYGATELMRAVVSLLDDFDRALSVESTDKVYSK